MNNRDIVYEVLDEYFKEENVDHTENLYTLIKFNNIIISNEYNDSCKIDDLFIKIKINENGTMNGSFVANRSIYSEIQFRNDYMHSHCPGIPWRNFSDFTSFCIGSGPIRQTITSLNMHFDKDMWLLFCIELDRCVRNESISGGPYRRISTIYNGRRNVYNFRNDGYYAPNCNTDEYDGFIMYMAEHDLLKYGFSNGRYTIANDDLSMLLNMSKYYMDYARLNNIDMINNMVEVVYDNNKIYYTNNEETLRDLSQFIDQYVCTFKGQRYGIQIYKDNKEAFKVNKLYVLPECDFRCIVARILKIVNENYE